MSHVRSLPSANPTTSSSERGLNASADTGASPERGASVAVLEQFSPGHTRGSSHGSARIVRRAYEDGLYTELTGRALATMPVVN